MMASLVNSKQIAEKLIMQSTIITKQLSNKKVLTYNGSTRDDAIATRAQNWLSTSHRGQQCSKLAKLASNIMWECKGIMKNRLSAGNINISMTKVTGY